MGYSLIKIERGVVKGGFVLLAAFGIYNFLNFIFQLSMARMLSLSDYGVMATIFSMIYILSVFSESIQVVIAKYSASEKKKGEIKNILKRGLKKSLLASLLLFFVYLVFAIPFSKLVKVDYVLLSLSGLVIFSTFLMPITRGIMQGQKRFGGLGINMILESFIKLVLAALFVYFGFRVYGAIMGAIIGTGLALIFSFLTLKDITKSKEEKIDTVEMYKYARPAFFVTLAVVALYSLDLVIARIVFSPELSGMYAVASILSKAIFWGTQPLSRAMFPMTAENHRDNKKSKNIFLNAFLMLISLVIIALSLFYFIPEFIIKIFSGEIIPESAKILIYLGLGTSFISIANLVLLYKLSLGKTRRYLYLFIFAVLEIILLLYFSNNLVEFSIAFMISCFVFLSGAVFLMKD